MTLATALAILGSLIAGFGVTALMVFVICYISGE